jgi:predicted TIM-barrel fold metal-dependent hydrolase
MSASGDRIIVVSTDSHAGVPPARWAEYLPAEYHDLLPKLRDDNKIYPTMIRLFTERLMTRPEYTEGHKTGGYRGLYDPDIRLAEMDREGVAAEMVYLGDFRLGDMFHNIQNDRYPLDAWAWGARGWNRFVSDTFGFATDRFLLVGAIGPCVDMDETLADLDWIADHDFAGTYAPGYMRHPDLPQLYDRYWDPYYERAVERGLPLVVHAGWGWDQGVSFDMFREMYHATVEAAGTDDLDALLAHPELWRKGVFGTGEFFSDIKPRRPLWQMILGGVFDRHPDLKVVFTEIRGDWLPPTLRHLDHVFEANRADIPAKEKPSEYWQRNFLVGVSFTHRSEVAIRHDIGIHQFTFGRDYPHPESTWPHTKEWMRAAFAGVPEDELRLILGENAARFLNLDRDRLAEIAARIGPTFAEINSGPPVPEDLIEHFDSRGGYLKPVETTERLDKVDEMLVDDLAAVAQI